MTSVVIRVSRGTPKLGRGCSGRLERFWMAGGRVCDWHPELLDAAVAEVTSGRRLPDWLLDAQAQVSREVSS